MEISRNVRRGFLGWRNERGHEVLNNALQLLPLSAPARLSSTLLSRVPPSLSDPRSTVDAGAPELLDRLAQSEPLHGFTSG